MKSFTISPESDNTDSPIQVHFIEQENRSGLVLLVGVLLIIGLAIFILKNWDSSSLLLAAGLVYPGRDYDNARDDSAWFTVGLSVLGIIGLAGFVISFIL